MASRLQFEGNNEIGVFAKLTNEYCIIGVSASSNFCSSLEAELEDIIPVVPTTLGGTRIVGRLTTGNRHGLLLPSITTDEELQHVRNALPDSVKVQRLTEKFSALGNIISCNDYVCLIHPETDANTKEVIADVLKVEVFSTLFAASQPLLGTYSVLNNKGGVVAPLVDVKELDQLSTLLQIPLTASTVNRGSSLIGSGLIANDWIAFAGADTTAAELTVIENILKINDGNSSKPMQHIKDSIVETLA